MIALSKPIITQDEIDAVVKVMQSGVIVQGPEVQKLEATFCELTGCKYAVAMNSGTAVIHAALYGLGVGDDDEVICPPFTFVATANAVLMAGAKPVFCDVDEYDYCLDPKKIEEKITSKSKAILAVSLYGQPFYYDAVKEIAEKHNLFIIEDAAQSIGARYFDKASGSLGDAGTFSLYATKNIHCSEGGVMVTNDENCYERAKMLRHHGQSEKTRYEYYDLGYNYRLTDIHAAIANVQMMKLDGICQQRRVNAEALTLGLQGIPGLYTPLLRDGTEHVYHQYTIRITQDCPKTRDEILQHLRDNQIGCGVYYPKPLHLHPHFSRMGYKLGDFPVSEQIAQEVLSLPVHPSLTQEEIAFIISTLKNYVC